MRDVEQRDHDGKRTNDLSEIREIVEIHSQGRRLAIDSVLELTFVLRAVEVTFRFCDESVID